MTRIISTDAGIDDALALILLHHYTGSPGDYLLATGGNVPLPDVVNNCAYLSSAFGWQTPLFAGSDPPPGAPIRDAADVHGPHGLARRITPAAAAPGLGRMVRDLEQGTEELDILVLGPATDAAELLSHPSLGGRVGRVMLMGGAFEPRDGRRGNVTPFAEFNVYMDPAAAWRVMCSEADVAFVPLDATEQRLFGASELLAHAGAGERAELVRELIEYLQAAHVRLGAGEGAFMHDVIAAGVWAGLLEAEWAEAGVREVVQHGERRGLIVTAEAGAARVRYARWVDAERFLNLWRRVVAAL